jgi:hypothetical protein
VGRSGDDLRFRPPAARRRPLPTYRLICKDARARASGGCSDRVRDEEVVDQIASPPPGRSRGTLGAHDEERQRLAVRDDEYVLPAPSSAGPRRRRWTTGTERSRNA